MSGLWPGWGNRKRWVVAGLGLLLGAVALWLLLRILPENADPTWERILETRELRVCTDPSWIPFGYLNANTAKIEGFDVDLARLVAARLVPAPSLQVRFVSLGFDGLYDALLASRCDAVLSALPHEPARTKDVAYSVAYFNAGPVILIREDMVDIETLDDLKGRVVGVDWGFVPQGNARQRGSLRQLALRRYETADETLRALHSGEVEAAIVDRFSALSYTSQCNGLEFVGEPIHDVNYVIPVRPDSFRLLEEINRVLLGMREDGTLEALQEKWF